MRVALPDPDVPKVNMLQRNADAMQPSIASMTDATQPFSHRQQETLVCEQLQHSSQSPLGETTTSTSTAISIQRRAGSIGASIQNCVFNINIPQ